MTWRCSSSSSNCSLRSTRSAGRPVVGPAGGSQREGRGGGSGHGQAKPAGSLGGLPGGGGSWNPTCGAPPHRSKTCVHSRGIGPSWPARTSSTSCCWAFPGELRPACPGEGAALGAEGRAVQTRPQAPKERCPPPLCTPSCGASRGDRWGWGLPPSQRHGGVGGGQGPGPPGRPPPRLPPPLSGKGAPQRGDWASRHLGAGLKCPFLGPAPVP